MGREELQRAPMRECRARRMVRTARPAVEAVVRAGIDVDLGRLARHRSAYLVDCGQRNVRIDLAVMELDRAADAGRAVELVVDAATVVGDGRIDTRRCRGQVSEPTAHAITHRTDLAAPDLGPCPQR